MIVTDEIAALAESWASIDGKTEEFKIGAAHKNMGFAHRDLMAVSTYDGYLLEAKDMIQRLNDRGFSIVRTNHTQDTHEEKE